jgi:hypothetical protein
MLYSVFQKVIYNLKIRSENNTEIEALKAEKRARWKEARREVEEANRKYLPSINEVMEE